MFQPVLYIPTSPPPNSDFTFDCGIGIIVDEQTSFFDLDEKPVIILCSQPAMLDCMFHSLSGEATRRT